MDGIGREITLENICKSYNGRKILDNFSMKIRLGEVACVIAPSGMGKTTLLRIMMGLEGATSGKITGMDGLKISAVFQEDRLCENLTPVANIKLVNSNLTKPQIISALESFGLGGSAYQRTSELSGGMKRRVAILRAMLAQYDIMFMDEPFKGLDEGTKDTVISEILKRTKGKTIIFVTHDSMEIEKMHTQNLIKL
jgi:NitT/TauT family transport system ATP-binding protein